MFKFYILNNMQHEQISAKSRLPLEGRRLPILRLPLEGELSPIGDWGGVVYLFLTPHPSGLRRPPVSATAAVSEKRLPPATIAPQGEGINLAHIPPTQIYSEKSGTNPNSSSSNIMKYKIYECIPPGIITYSAQKHLLNMFETKF